ncbi:hypothetical protein HRG_013251 [Hirsutella rhossiliensis]
METARRSNCEVVAEKTAARRSIIWLAAEVPRNISHRRTLIVRSSSALSASGGDPEDEEQRVTAAAGDVPSVHSKEVPKLRSIQPREPVFDNLRENGQLAAAIASGLPKRRRGRSWRVKGVPGRRGVSNAAGTAQHPGPSPVGCDAAAEPADASLSGRRLQQREVGGSSRVAAGEPVQFDRQQERGECWKGQGLRSRFGVENVRQHGPVPVQCKGPDGVSGDAHVVGQSSPKLPHPTACEEANQPRREEIMDRRRPGGGPEAARRREKRKRLPGPDERPRKQIRSGIGRQRSRELRAEDLASVLRFLEEDFAMKERLSNDQTWCTPIPHDRKVSTVRDFYQAFHDASTLPIRTCMTATASLRARGRPLTIFMPELLSRSVPDAWRAGVCRRRSIFTLALALKGLTPVEEKLVSLNSCYGFVTRYSIPGGQRQAVRYPRHVKGHITVFPNNVQELATKVLPHPLLQALDEIHVSWQGVEKPAPSDLSSLLSVRRRVVERALVWLKRSNPHYAEIEIDVAEMESWETR